ncbi:MAG: alkylresorcinol/alkylpyrone synthase [Actinomycetota bacterium]|jgi:alkylresorcinol/alkylpyrone synthase|nr:alkylresorcinol/alkylpyrone synthase [Actinomycetota bacterium]
MSRIVGVAPALPPHRYPQQTLTDAFAELVLPPGTDRRVLDRLHAAAGVRTRHLALPLESYPALAGFGAANDAFIEVGVELGTEAITAALDKAGLRATDIDLIVSTSVTGVAAPSLDARLVPRLGLRPDIKRLPIFGLGCVAGAAGIARVHDFLQGDPDGVAVLLSVELCSLTVQRDDPSIANLVASGLFGDGAAAVLMVGERRAAAMGLTTGARQAPQVVATRSRFYPGTERVMGWDIGGTGFRIVLDASVAEVVERYVGGDLATFLAAHDLKTSDIARWISHPGGPKVLDALQRAAGLPDDALALSWECLARVGNLSSASVLHVLADTLDASPPVPGASGVLLAMGPGFCAELVLLRW